MLFNSLSFKLLRIFGKTHFSARQRIGPYYQGRENGNGNNLNQ